MHKGGTKLKMNTFALTLGGLVGWFFGELNGFFYALLTLIILDYMTGIITAIVAKNLSSQTGFKGIAKKVFILGLVALGNILDTQILGGNSAIKTAIILFYSANEMISIIENATILGLPIPKKLVDVLEQLKKDSDKND